MTIATTVSSVTLAGNGATTVFPYDFTIPGASATDQTYVAVSLCHVADGTIDPLDDAEWTIGRAVDGVGGLVFYNPSAGPLPAGWTITILRVLPAVQSTTVNNQTLFYGKSIENEFDYLTMLVQGVAGDVGRSLKFPVQDGAALNSTLPPAAVRANSGLVFDGAGQPLAGVLPSVAVSAAMTGFFQSATLTAAALLLAPVIWPQQAATGAFWVGNGAKVNRLNDRVLVGGATVSDAAFPNVTQDWLATYQSYIYAGGGTPPTVTTLMNVLGQPGAQGAGEAFLAGAHTGPALGAQANAIGIQGYGIANNTAFGGDFSWAFYGEGHRAHAGTGNCFGAEICIVNRADLKINTPYLSEPGSTIGIQIDSGCGYNHAVMPDVVSASTALEILDNSGGNAPFLNGICFQTGSIVDAGGGEHPAIVMPSGYKILWYSADNNPTSSIIGGVADHTKATGISFTDSGFLVTGESRQTLVRVPNLASAANYVQLDAALAGGNPGVAAMGTDANIHLHLTPKGTGVVKIGGGTTTSATGGAATALPALPVSYLSILDAAGNSRKIPLYAN